MFNQTNYQIKPLSINMFQRKFDVPLKGAQLCQAYGIYLQTNMKQHHYTPFRNLEEWLYNETKDIKC